MMITRKFDRRFAALAAAASLSFGGAADAASVTASFTVQASVVTSCTLTAPNGATIDFQNYSGTQIQKSAALLTYNCTTGGSATLTLNDGNNAVSGQRKMKAGTGPSATFLNYELFSDNTYTTAWNSSTTPTLTYDGNNHALTVYAQLDAGQALAVGNYTDSITATITF